MTESQSDLDSELEREAMRKTRIQARSCITFTIDGSLAKLGIPAFRPRFLPKYLEHRVCESASEPVSCSGRSRILILAALLSPGRWSHFPSAIHFHHIRDLPANTRSASMAWTETSSSVYSRPLGKCEHAMTAFISGERPSPREPIKIHCIADFTTSRSAEEVIAASRQAWKAVRLLKDPGIATTFENRRTEYKIPSAEDLEVWLGQTFAVAETGTSADEAIRETYTRLEWLSTLLLIPHHTTDSSFRASLVLFISHWRTEAQGAFRILNSVFTYVSDILAGGSTRDALSSHKLGSEVNLLIPAIEDIMMPNKESTPESKARIDQHMEKYTSALPTVEFPISGDLTAPSSYMKRSQRIYTAQSTSNLVSKCKSEGISVTAAIEAAYLGAIWQMAPKDQQSRLYACMMPTQVRTRLDKSSPYREQGCWNAAQMLWITAPPGHDFLTRAKHLGKQYKLADDPTWLYKDAREVIDETLSPSGETPDGPIAVPWFTSIGLLDGTTFVSDHADLKVERVAVWADNLYPGIVFGQWSFRGRLNLQIHWNVAYHTDAQIEQCLNIMERIFGSELGTEMAIEEVRGAEELY